MNKLQTTAKRLDTVFKALQIAFLVFAIVMLVFAAIAGAAYLFDLPLDIVSESYELLDLETVELTLAPGQIPAAKQIFLIEGISMAIICICSILVWQFTKTVRQILAPMKDGKPFHDTVSKGLKKLAIMIIIVGVAVNIMELISLALIVNAYDLPGLLISDKVTHVTVNYDFDPSFLITAGLFLLLSYIFHYGSELQEQVDETL